MEDAFPLKLPALMEEFSIPLHLFVSALLELGIVVHLVIPFPHASPTKSIIPSITNAFVSPDWFGLLLRMLVGILLVRLGKDGMDLAVWIFHALLDLTIMELSVYAQILQICANHGSTLMDLNACILKILAQKEQDGMEKLVYQPEIVLQVSINKTLNASHFHKGAYLLLSGAMENVQLELNALTVHSNPVILASHTLNAKTVKPGTVILFNVYALKELDGTVCNA